MGGGAELQNLMFSRKRHIDQEEEYKNVEIHFKGDFDMQQSVVSGFLKTIIEDLHDSLCRAEILCFSESVYWSCCPSSCTHSPIICITIQCTPGSEHIDNLSSALIQEVLHICDTFSTEFEILNKQIKIICSESCDGIVVEWAAMQDWRVRTEDMQKLEAGLWRSFGYGLNIEWVDYWVKCGGPRPGSLERVAIRSYFIFRFPMQSNKFSFRIKHEKDIFSERQSRIFSLCIKRLQSIWNFHVTKADVAECIKNLDHMQFILKRGSVIASFRALSPLLADILMTVLKSQPQQMPTVIMASVSTYTGDEKSKSSITLLSLGTRLLHIIYNFVPADVWHVHATGSRQLYRILHSLIPSLNVISNEYNRFKFKSEKFQSDGGNQNISLDNLKGMVTISWNTLLEFLSKKKKEISINFLSVLDLTSCKICSAGAKILAARLSCPNICKLQLLDNYIGSDGIEFIARSSLINTQLAWLGLGGNIIGSTGLKFLCDKLSICTKLEGLDLSDNALNDDGVTSAHLLSRALVGLSSVSSLHLQWNSLGDHQTALILETLKNQITTLTDLDLRNNDLSADVGYTMITFLNLLSSGPKSKISRVNQLPIRAMRLGLTSRFISILTLSYRRLGPAEACILSEFLINGLHCSTLFLRGNVLRSEGAEIIAKGVFASLHLQLLDVGCNKIGRDGLLALKASAGHQKLILMDGNIHESVTVSTLLLLILISMTLGA